jgi:FMN phosphatase YigB (HAD superfamily)
MKELVKSATTLIFDLGGVVINLSYKKTYEAFSQLSGRTVEEISSMAAALEEFKMYEKGNLEDSEFRHFIRTRIGIEANDTAIDTAWNAMLLDIPEARLKTLLTLGESHQVFLLSNTNAIHLRAFNEIVEKVSGRPSLDYYFDKTYYSHEMGMRKPDVEIYRQVIGENRLSPAGTLFFDDLVPNLAGASQAGLLTYHVTNADELFEKLDSIE